MFRFFVSKKSGFGKSLFDFVSETVLKHSGFFRKKKISLRIAVTGSSLDGDRVVAGVGLEFEVCFREKMFFSEDRFFGLFSFTAATEMFGRS